ncbi:MAG: tRNA uridine-5-carboxymethylaminomethyl(34) synthesis GTPase MnmE [Dictyoglomus sp. NZ13-RE01]|nr:MAG: tRNA uridine-5-carboxymethylaminomethyl(34) synthesis GTPase MnmE [Dictyoglomus sp. NZ13-RE01]
MKKYLEDDIVAISTPLGHSGIGVVRLSGPNVISLLKKVFIPFKKKDIEKVPSHTLHYGKIVDGERVIDEVMVAILRAPKTYTKEDMVEIYAHGSPLILREIVTLFQKLGARLADRGEFTKRAFLNGRIDLLQAEGVLDLIYARSNKVLDFALKKLEGDFSKRLKTLKDKIERVRIFLEAVLDFPEDVSDLEKEKWKDMIREISQDVKYLIEKSEKGEWLRGGYKIILVGRPNVGKSSLFNALMREERVIVSPYPGTTRDYIEGELILSGFIVKLYDTAGLREPKDEIEALGIEKTKELIHQANLIFFLIDNSEGVLLEDIRLYEQIKSINNKIVLVINKMDLPSKINEKEIREKFRDVMGILHISTYTKEGLDKLEDFILSSIEKEELEDVIFLNIHHQTLLKSTYELLTESLEILNWSFGGYDIIAENLYEAEKLIGNILGEETSIDIVDKIFENFCVGK